MDDAITLLFIHHIAVIQPLHQQNHQNILGDFRQITKDLFHSSAMSWYTESYDQWTTLRIDLMIMKEGTLLMKDSPFKKHGFAHLGVSEFLCDALTQQRIDIPTPVQTLAIPAAYSGKDVIAQAQTGTGKTLAFLLPLFDTNDPEIQGIQGLIITPTRELAIQITAEARKLAHFKKLNILAAYGGQDIESQTRKLKGNIHLVIGTPGRILDHMRRKNIALNHVRYLVLDEADQMLHMGFLPDVEAIISQTPKKRQTLCFSATMPHAIKLLANRFMNVPVPISIKSEQITLKSIQQRVIETSDRNRQDALIATLRETTPYMAIIFCRTKRRVSALLEALHAEGFKCDELHGDLTQSKRERVMKLFRTGAVQLLIATDVAARGLDIDGITHVFNYDVAGDAESYIHRIGRTGRAGNTGVSITFAAPTDRVKLLDIERGIGMTLSKSRMPGDHIPDEPRKTLPKHLNRNGNAREKTAAGKGRFSKSGPSADKKGPSDRKSSGAMKGHGKPKPETARPSAPKAETVRLHQSPPRAAKPDSGKPKRATAGRSEGAYKDGASSRPAPKKSYGNMNSGPKGGSRKR